jgi:hypothetical protein
MKFEVGKKYECLGGNHPIYECVFAGENMAVIKGLVSGKEFSVLVDGTYYYKEFVEPKKGTIYVSIVKSGFDDGGVFPVSHKTREDALKPYWNKAIARIEVPWTEGEGLDW